MLFSSFNVAKNDAPRVVLSKNNVVGISLNPQGSTPLWAYCDLEIIFFIY